MARGKKGIARPRQSVFSSSDPLPSQPLPLATTSHSDPALLLPVGSQPSSADLGDAAQPTASEPPSEAVASIGDIDSETSGIKRSFVWQHFIKYDKFETASSSTTTSIRSANSRRSNLLNDWKNVVQETEEAVTKHEVDQYLEAPLELIEDSDCFDILLWWKLNGCKYPVLAAIARDALSIQVSTVVSESSFSTGGRVIDCLGVRSSLTPKTVEGLICTQNWLLGDDIAEFDCTVENYAFYESLEEEHEGTTTSQANTCPPPPPRAKAKGKSTDASSIIDV